MVVRAPAVAGMFYPADPRTLTGLVDELLAGAPAPDRYVRAVIAPHAGYIYSGPTAARAYRALDPALRRVLILGPTHRVAIDGMALSGADSFDTPLGRIPADADLAAELAALPGVVTSPAVHAEEHSLEVHLPFLARRLGAGLTVVPVAVGDCAPGRVAAVLAAAWAHPDVAIVISSDLSHYLPDDLAREVDAATIAQILALSGPLDPRQACGAAPVSGMLAFARGRGLSAALLEATNSSDTAGDARRVVGYAALAFAEPDARHDQLPALAYNAIAARLGAPLVPGPDARSFPAPGASFVTLTAGGRLRGCIGSLTAHRPLGADVEHNAQAAAFSDPRFTPLTAGELDTLGVEVAVLSAPEPLAGDPRTERDVIDRLTPGSDGVILTRGAARATFLPTVWDQIPDPRDFLAQLRAKAGLAPDAWDEQISVQTYRVISHRLDRGRA